MFSVVPYNLRFCQYEITVKYISDVTYVCIIVDELVRVFDDAIPLVKVQ